MTLDEAIERYTSNAEYERTHGNLQGCLEFRLLAEWLKDYKRLRELELQPCEQQPCEDAISRAEAIRVASGYCHWSNIPDELAKLPSVNPIPCKDAISRQAAIDAMATWDWQELYLPIHFKQLLEDLPSVSTEKTGRWIDDEFGSKCSFCGIHTHLDKFDRPMKFKHCSMCGAKMEAEE